MSLRLESLRPENLAAFRALMGSKDFGGCFCAVWTSHGEDWSARCQDASQPNFEVTRKRVEAGAHTGFLVYRESELIGWTGAGPKTDFPFLEKKLASRLSNFSAEVWSIGCLALGAAFRGKGQADLIVEALIQEATKLGAKTLETYPTRPYDEGRVFRGTEALYRRHGFVEVGSEQDGEHEILLMQLNLRASPPSPIA